MTDWLIRENRNLHRYEVVQEEKVLAWVTLEAVAATNGEALQHALNRLARVGLIDTEPPPAPSMPSLGQFAEMAAHIRRRVQETKEEGE